jgi:hypothetical protein
MNRRMQLDRARYARLSLNQSKPINGYADEENAASGMDEGGQTAVNVGMRYSVLHALVGNAGHRCLSSIQSRDVTIARNAALLVAPAEFVRQRGERALRAQPTNR